MLNNECFNKNENRLQQQWHEIYCPPPPTTGPLLPPPFAHCKDERMEAVYTNKLALNQHLSAAQPHSVNAGAEQ